jgi:hypothetical protein
MSMRRASLVRQLGQTIFAHQASIFAGRPIANRVLRAPGTTDSCDIGAEDPEGRLLERLSQPDWVFVVGTHQVSGRQALNIGFLFLANVPYAIDLCAMVWFSARDYVRGVNRLTYRAAIEEFQ